MTLLLDSNHKPSADIHLTPSTELW